MMGHLDMKKLHDIFLSCGKVATDSRKAGNGELFFALKGENFDGNDFALDALRNGAAYAVVSESWAKNHNAEIEEEKLQDRVIRVKDTLETLQSLARYHRENTFLGNERLTVIALTGTNGKTTTKELIREVLSCRFCVTATEGNLNNNIGVPLTLLSINEETEIAVVEMGASHPGDIKELVNIAQPDYGLVTNVGKAHLLGFVNFEGVKKTKGELYDFIKSHGQRVFVNADSEDLRSMVKERRGLKTVQYGVRYQGAVVLQPNGRNPFLKMLIPVVKTDPRTGRSYHQGTMLEVRTNLIGSYNADNVMSAIAVGKYFGISEERAVEAINRYVPSNNRSQMLRTADNTLIVDAYNANPSSMSIALDNFACMDARVKIAMVGDMKELGDESLSEHRRILEKIKDMITHGKLTKAYFVGDEFAKAGADSFADVDALMAALKEEMPHRATILIKGSHSVHMERLKDVL